MVTAYLGLGTNIGDRAKNLACARDRLAERLVIIESVSPVYISKPWGFKSDHDFYNQVIATKTKVDAFDLLDLAQEIENIMGRLRSMKGYSDRIIDIDILFYGNEIISSKPLIIPHPLLHKRIFVLQPMADIAPGFIHPVLNKTIKELMEECGDRPLKGAVTRIPL
ncbi:MAG: 2-amino-4-hydroxy-6-hydroxymethyldihydropteridine diphosphokinase [Bacteroidales bacterium]|nr:2-amino-4-hydroxy-6-hydroxymethyldihydropteridine diphosphokinase [Bacteroidales bacterium]